MENPGQSLWQRHHLLTAPLLLSALLFSMFFNGVGAWSFCSTFLILLGVFTWSVWSGGREGLQLPNTPLTWSLLLYWGWLGLIIFWSPVPYLATVSFWWMGAPTVVYLAYSMLPTRHHPAIWGLIRYGLVLIGFVLAVVTLFQLYAHGVEPRGPLLYRNSFAAILGMIALLTVSSLLHAFEQGQRPAMLFNGVIFSTLCFVIVTINSLGVFLVLSLAMLFFVWYSRRLVSWKAWGLVFALMVTVMVLHKGVHQLASPTWQAPEKLSQVIDVVKSPSLITSDSWQKRGQRVLLMKSGWRMLQDAPWYGTGTGFFWLQWPPYQDLNDVTSGTYLHSDPIQIAIEAGLPGILLLLAVFYALIRQFRRFLRSTQTLETRLEGVALMAAIMAIAIYCTFDFILYVLPVLVLLGLFMARLATLSMPTWMILPLARFTNYGHFRLLAMAVIMMASSYFVTYWIGDYHHKKGLELAKSGKHLESEEALDLATRLVPNQDNFWYTRSSLFVALAEQEKRPKERRNYFDVATEMMDEALRHNPYRAGVHYMRGKLMINNQDLAGDLALLKGEAALRDALQLNPRFLAARTLLVMVLHNTGKDEAAAKELKEGMRYLYPRWLVNPQDTMEFYKIALQLLPDPEGHLKQHVAEMVERFDLLKPIPTIEPEHK